MATSSSNDQWYDLFISHRGPDTKETFARSLYLRLLGKGFKPFLNEREMQPGYEISSQINHAIQTARVHVAILSPGYADSSWCLDELIMMLESKDPIIPVFYGVTPDQVRWTRGKDGNYALALQKLENKETYDPQTGKAKRRYDSDRIKNWRNALSKVADISGFELAKGHELELLDKVVKRLGEMLEKQKLNVAKYPTGLDEKLKHFEDTVLLPLQRSGKPQILGIWGLGGVGKTTMAKEFFNMKQSDYHKSCFLFDVRDNAAKDSLQSLQKKLLKDLTGLDKTIGSVDEGTEMLKKHTNNLKSSNSSLVILDDVDNANQVYALLPVDLPLGSLILITCRDKHVLLTSGVQNSSIYRLTGLNDHYSRELFCSYAFSQTYPHQGFKSLVDSFVKTCNGLPLSLKIFGANLYGRDVPYWEDQLRSFPSDIGDRLKISYNALKIEEKQIFLDTACFFIGQNRDTAISTWDASGWEGRLGFQILQDRCLVEVDEWNSIHMHDHLRDLGREIAEDHLRDLGREIAEVRLWRWTEKVIGNLLQQPSVIRVRGIKMDRSEYNDEDDVLGAIRLRRLQILDTEDSLLERILTRVELSNILWLRWRNCPYSSLPSWFPLKNLRYLKVSGSVLNTLWQREGESQAPLQLPVYLEEFSAEECVELKNILGLAQCTKLRKLIVTGCSELEELPSMEALVSLEGLRAEGCVKLKSIRGLAQCTKLQLLDVRGCSELEELPSMEALVSLEWLMAEGCVKLKSIRGLAQCTKLQRLDVGGCSELEELPSMEALVSLEQLRAEGCVKLKSIWGLAQCTKLQRLDVRGCSELEELPSMEALVSLERLRAEGCVKLKSIRGLAQCTKLQRLWAEGCVKLKSIRGLAQCTKLQWLDVCWCSELEELPSMETLVDVCWCSELEELPSMETLVSLEELWAEGCVKLKSIRGLAHCTKLQRLYVGGCSELEELPSMETLVSLEGLWAEGCVKLKSIRGLAHCTKLRWLDVGGCSELEELPSMEALVCLEGLWAEGCVKLKSLRGLAHCTKLQFLNVSWCSELEELPSMETLVSLEELWAYQCVGIFGGVVGISMCEAEEHTGVIAVDKASKVKCEKLLGVRRSRRC